MTTNIFGNTYQFRGYCFPVASVKIPALETGAKGIAVDGGYKVRSEEFAIQNIDSTASLYFSFDSTNFNVLDPNGAFSEKLATDRIYIKSGATDNSCYVQMTIALRNNWKY
jgi:hypothetical protein